MFSNRIWIVWDEQLIILSLVESSFLTFSTHHHLIPFVPKKIPSARRQCLPREEVQSVVKREKLKSMDIRIYMNIIQHELRSWCMYLFLKCRANCFGDGESSQALLLSFLSGHGTYTQYGWNQHVRTFAVPSARSCKLTCVIVLIIHLYFRDSWQGHLYAFSVLLVLRNTMFYLIIW